MAVFDIVKLNFSKLQYIPIYLKGFAAESNVYVNISSIGIQSGISAHSYAERQLLMHMGFVPKI
jgi:hypothetical protein